MDNELGTGISCEQDVYDELFALRSTTDWAYDCLTNRVCKIFDEHCSCSYNTFAAEKFPTRSEFSKWGVPYADACYDSLEDERILKFESGIETNRDFIEKCNYLIAEFYLYIAMMKYSNFFFTGVDPFIDKKMVAWDAVVSNKEANLSLFHALEIGSSNLSIIEKKILVQSFLFFSLSGNCIDLSQTNFLHSNLSASVFDEELLLCNDAIPFIEHLLHGCSVLSIVCDNCGVEFYADVLLALCVIELGFVDSVEFCVKAFPTFVSDVTVDDVPIFLHMLQREFPNVYDMYDKHAKSGVITYKGDYFFNNPTDYIRKEHLLNRIVSGDTAIFKGDLNYRRLVYDRDYPIDMSVSAFPKHLPSLALRTLKSDVLVGVEKDVAHRAEQKDVNWRVNGRFGVIQFFVGVDEHTTHVH
ncbi:hypothetical protein PCE1_002261 [Barthelona sp. PCE]